MQLRINLFRRFEAFRGEAPHHGFDAARLQELLCYLLLHRQHPHRREVLIDKLWGAALPKHPRKYLRHLLWQLRKLLPFDEHGTGLLKSDQEWVALSAHPRLEVDIDRFEQAYERVCNVAGGALTAEQKRTLEDGVALYRGELLEGWYQEWCIFERERLQQRYLLMLDKLLDYAVSHGEFESGLQHGIAALRCDGAREMTYRSLMQLCYVSGDRAGAQRYYSRCVEVLRNELDVSPSVQTQALYHHICTDQLTIVPAAAPQMENLSEADQLAQMLGICTTLQQLLESMVQQMNR